jgi:hypothetical protein
MIQQVGAGQGRFWETALGQKSGPNNFWELFQAEQAKGMIEESTRSLPAEGNQSKYVDLLKSTVNETGEVQDNPSVWDELSKEYDIHHATFNELCDISQRLYNAKQISLADHAVLSFDPSRIPGGDKANFYFTPADAYGKRDWIAEYQARANFELKNGNPSNCQYIVKHFVDGILRRLEK